MFIVVEWLEFILINVIVGNNNVSCEIYRLLEILNWIWSGWRFFLIVLSIVCDYWCEICFVYFIGVNFNSCLFVMEYLVFWCFDVFEIN